MRRVLPLMLLLSASAAAANGHHWLQKATTAVRTTDYRGTLVYLRDGAMDTLRIVHRYQNGNEWARLLSKTGERREIIRKNDHVIFVLPQRKVILESRNARPKLLPKIASGETVHWRDHYRVKALGKRRQASRMCHVISIEPKDQFRYGYRLLLDAKTHLPLKLVLRYEGQALEQLMFTSISFPKSIPSSVLKSQFITEAYRRVRHKPRKQLDIERSVQWRINKLPAGFELTEIGVRRVRKNVVARQFLYTDGVATVSAFVAPITGSHTFKGATTMGATNAYGRHAHGYQITVVGQVPDVTVRWIAEHMRYKANQTSQSSDVRTTK